MNRELQFQFESQMLDSDIVKDRMLFNKDRKGIYKEEIIWWMYRVWVNQEVRFNKLKDNVDKKVEESYMMGYTCAESDFRSYNINRDKV